MNDNKAFIHESITNQVRMGFMSIEEIEERIYEEIEDNGFGKEISKEWAKKSIEQEHKKLLSESKKWTIPTDIERLVQAFNELCENNIIALHNAGYTTSDGEYEVLEVEKGLNAEGLASDGYCFYHEQDLLRTIDKETFGLYIAFQKINNQDDTTTLSIGKRVVRVLKKHGFDIHWNESPNTKILIPDFKWQLLFNDDNIDLLDYDRILGVMIESNTKHRKTSTSKLNKENNFWSKIKNLFTPQRRFTIRAFI